MSTTVKEDVNEEAKASPDDGVADLPKFDFRDPRFMADAYDRYAAFRAQGPVTHVQFGFDEPADEEERRRQELFGRDAYLITHYEEGNEALLDPHLSVDRFSTMTPEQRAEMEKMSEQD